MSGSRPDNEHSQEEEGIMLKNLSVWRAIGAWFVVLAVTTLTSLTFGAAATFGTWTLLMLIAFIPPAIALVVWRGAPPPTVAEILYSVNQQGGR
jgi:hypothetical protein